MAEAAQRGRHLAAVLLALGESCPRHSAPKDLVEYILGELEGWGEVW